MPGLVSKDLIRRKYSIRNYFFIEIHTNIINAKVSEDIGRHKLVNVCVEEDLFNKHTRKATLFYTM